MSCHSQDILLSLNSIIDSLPQRPEFNSLIYDSQKNFTRDSKFGFSNTVHFLFSAGPSTLKNELSSYSSATEFNVTSSAIVQSRSKIKPSLFRFIFDQLNQKYPCDRTYKGYRLIAVDGSKSNIPYNPKDRPSLHLGVPKANGEPGKGYNQVHLSTSFDILDNRYLDCIIKDITLYNEIYEMKELVDRYSGPPAIFIADRGFESSNLIEHLSKKTKFILRVKDTESCATGLMKGLIFPNDEFDVDYRLIFTNYNRKEYQQQKSLYKIILKNQRFDFLNDQNHFYETAWRIVRFKLEDNYETIVTNLDRHEFDSSEIKYLYNLRWRTETAYRYLKHDFNLIHFISRKKDFILQEIWVKLTLYNLSSLITNLLEATRKEKKKRKHIHKINFSNAAHLISRSIKLTKRKGGIPPDLDAQIINDTSPVREGRRYKRIPHAQTYPASNYRAY